MTTLRSSCKDRLFFFPLSVCISQPRKWWSELLSIDKLCSGLSILCAFPASASLSSLWSPDEIWASLLLLHETCPSHFSCYTSPTTQDCFLLWVRSTEPKYGDRWIQAIPQGPWTAATCCANFLVLDSTCFTSDKEVSTMPLLLSCLHALGHSASLLSAMGFPLLPLTLLTSLIHCPSSPCSCVCRHRWGSVTCMMFCCANTSPCSLTGAKSDPAACFWQPSLSICSTGCISPGLGPQNQKRKWSGVPQGLN